MKQIIIEEDGVQYDVACLYDRSTASLVVASVVSLLEDWDGRCYNEKLDRAVDFVSEMLDMCEKTE